VVGYHDEVLVAGLTLQTFDYFKQGLFPLFHSSDVILINMVEKFQLQPVKLATLVTNSSGTLELQFDPFVFIEPKYGLGSVFFS